jgi:hypothetical protein
MQGTLRIGRIAVFALGLLGATLQATAQTDSTNARPKQAAQPPSPAKLPVSVERIQKKLAELPPTVTDKLKLEYYIEVYGKAPPPDFLQNFNVKSGPVPFSAPTHQDLLDVVTPAGFRTPAPNISAFIEWLRRKAAQ